MQSSLLPQVARRRPRSVPRGPLDGALTFIVVLHVLISLVHGIAHQRVPVDLTAWQGVFVAVVVVISPVAGIVVRARGRWRTGTLVTAVSMLASVVFGTLYHFVLGGDDNVRLHGAWNASAHHSLWAWVFTVSAVLVVASELVGAVVAGLALAAPVNNDVIHLDGQLRPGSGPQSPPCGRTPRT